MRFTAAPATSTKTSWRSITVTPEHALTPFDHASVPGTALAPAAAGAAPARRSLRRLPVAALRVALLSAAVWALRRELSGLSLGDLIAQARGYGLRHFFLAVACTVASFVLLGALEATALRQLGGGARSRRVPLGVAMTTAFVANAFSQSVGLALLTGTAVRLRAYGRYGMSAPDVARVSGWITLSVAMGLLAASAGALLAGRGPLVAGQMTIAARPLGAALALVVLAYLAWAASRHGDAIGAGRWRLPRPTLATATTQVGLSAIDWLLTAAVLFAFVPASVGIGYWTLLRAYVIAQAVGMLSHVPGAVGVLELTLLALLAHAAPRADVAGVVASLVIFRVVYYLAPLVVATAMAGAHELHRPHAFLARPEAVDAD